METKGEKKLPALARPAAGGLHCRHDLHHPHLRAGARAAPGGPGLGRRRLPLPAEGPRPRPARLRAGAHRRRGVRRPQRGPVRPDRGGQDAAAPAAGGRGLRAQVFLLGDRRAQPGGGLRRAGRRAGGRAPLVDAALAGARAGGRAGRRLAGVGEGGGAGPRRGRGAGAAPVRAAPAPRDAADRAGGARFAGRPLDPPAGRAQRGPVPRRERDHRPGGRAHPRRGRRRPTPGTWMPAGSSSRPGSCGPATWRCWAACRPKRPPCTAAPA